MVLCAGAFGCYAAQGSLPGAQGQGYDLNLSYSRTTLKAVADAITQQVGIAFSYETALAGYPIPVPCKVCVKSVGFCPLFWPVSLFLAIFYRKTVLPFLCFGYLTEFFPAAVPPPVPSPCALKSQ